MSISRLFVVLVALAPVQALQLPVGRRVGAVASHAAIKPWPVSMKSQEDKEFEEWVRQKKIASGVDPDEDFAAGRGVESGIYTVGGLITVLVPLIAGIWAYNEGYLTPQ
eukprot:CAMPEP_0206160822 /NCGR_PEP_ID=MMETSP1474-20131121/7140_1 /ASSEMBLY_ACC=CAM_ASM_001110 /TAXON_ID=97495 /ORGANISM="Imantonia sp., Strain RCC918" /LENGTH=108 /DNA_ID=CAMNT_0053562403 /DNA_START=28 /DNA_END=354 /DNA_ORIENTATION=+